jgi:hypothetical protein
MPRQIDLFSQNLQVTHDPNNQISVTAAQINHLNDQIPAALAKAEQLFLNNVLTAIDQATGLDLVAWLADAQSFFNFISSVLQQSSLNFQSLINGVVGQADTDVTALIAALQTIGGNAQTAFTAWDVLFTDLGFSVTTASELATWLSGVANAGPWPGTTNAEALTNRAIYKPSYLAIDSTADAVFPVSQITDSSKVVAVTPDSSVIGYIGTPDAGLKQSIIWLAPTVGSGLTLYLSVYSLNTTTGACTLMFTIGPVTTAAAGWNYTTIPTIDQFVSVQGAWYAVELMMEGTAGTSFNIAGEPNHYLPVNTITPSFPQSLGGSRNSITPVVFDVADTTGVRASLAASTSPNWTESFTAPVGDDVVVSVAAYSNGTAITSIVTTYGGVSMSGTSLSPNTTASNGLLEVFRLAGAGSGTAKTVSVTVNNSSSAITWVSIRATSYKNAATTTASTSSAAGSGTALAVSPTGIADGLTIVAFMSIGSLSSASIGTPTGANQRAAWNSGGNDYPALMVCDSSTVGSFSVTATAGASNPWCAVTIRLAGTPALPPSTIAAPGPPYSNNVPWFGLGGTLGVPQHDPEVTTLTAASGTYTVPTWMALGDLIDIVLVGDGGGGGPGSTIFSYGSGGNHGVWAAFTLTYGIDVPLTTTAFTYTIGQGGAGGVIEISNGAAGSGCAVTITGYTGPAITAAGGAVSGSNPTYFGLSPGNLVYTSGLGNTTYMGGAEELIANANGAAPGGGGAGGAYLANGGHGAPGQIWITAYQ